MCKTILAINNTVTTIKTIFCGLCPDSSWHLSHRHGHSRITNSHDNPSINAENTKSHGSNHSGIKSEEWATSGANRPITDKTIGNTQQNKCGNIVAIIPIFTALFFMSYPLHCIFCLWRLRHEALAKWRPQQECIIPHHFVLWDLFAS